MKVEVLSYDEHTRLREQEAALQQDRKKYSFSKWSKARRKLTELLKVHAQPDTTGYGSGDFFIGDDWFENGGLHVVILRWKALSEPLLVACHRFLKYRQNDFLITVAKTLSSIPEEDFEIVITPPRIYMSLFERSAVEARDLITRDDRFAAIKSAVNYGNLRNQPGSMS